MYFQNKIISLCAESSPAGDKDAYYLNENNIETLRSLSLKFKTSLYKRRDKAIETIIQDRIENLSVESHVKSSLGSKDKATLAFLKSGKALYFLRPQNIDAYHLNTYFNMPKHSSKVKEIMPNGDFREEVGHNRYWGVRTYDDKELMYVGGLDRHNDPCGSGELFPLQNNCPEGFRITLNDNSITYHYPDGTIQVRTYNEEKLVSETLELNNGVTYTIEYDRDTRKGKMCVPGWGTLRGNFSGNYPNISTDKFATLTKEDGKVYDAQLVNGRIQMDSETPGHKIIVSTNLFKHVNGGFQVYEGQCITNSDDPELVPHGEGVLIFPN
ncbi:MAG: hypothetical protein HRT90_04290, partial [Candidatus Margulisbacteria bacterium]|nr:hypothetical protein [Candidatus Margulisiibacteriota bacterium]